MIITGATPLIALEATAIDTETTGLDPAKARIVQIGAVSIARGRVETSRQIELLVNPGEHVPAASSSIHGITDAAVRGAPAFPTALARLREFAGESVLVGHSIGYDLAVIENECRRAGVSDWAKPRALCVRMLAQLAQPTLPDHSLETIAAWLGVEITGRHSAAGDAMAAAQTFIRLLPELRKRGIRTLGEAETACLGLSVDLQRSRGAGWVDPVSRPAPPAFRAIDPYAYLHRVGEVMSHPVVVMGSATPMREAIACMSERKISSVFVSDGAEPGMAISDYGILTERDVMRRIAGDAEGSLRLPIGGLATRPLESIAANAFVYRAIGRMDRLKIRHLAVRDEMGRLTGIVSARDLLRMRAGQAIALDDAIASADHPGEMAAAWAMLPGIASALLAEAIDARLVAEIVSEELCLLTMRAAQLAELAMNKKGLGSPPCGYAVLVLGSGGRGESLLAADQDNAIVFERGGEGGPEDQWFRDLAAGMAGLLDASGVPFCKGGVMAKNPAFRGSLASWRARVDSWIGRSRPEDLLNVDIFFDLRAVHGDLKLGSELLDYAFARGGAEPAFAKLLGEQARPASPFNLFGGFRLEEGRLDLKMNALFPIVSIARMLAIRHGVRAQSTRDRLAGLIERGIGGENDLRAMMDGHAAVIAALLQQQCRDLHAGIPVSNRVEMARLPPDEKASLKEIMNRLRRIPDLVRDLMFA